MPWRRSRGQGETPAGDIISWANKHMTDPMKILQEHAQDLTDLGVGVVQDQIVSLNRIADPHNPKDTPNDPALNMLRGVQGKVTQKKADEVSLSVGWDLRQYRHGYPQIQDLGLGGIAAMGALTLADHAMKLKLQTLMEQAKRKKR